MFRTNIEEMEAEGYFFYIATRLFDYSQKIQAEHIDKMVCSTVRQLLSESHYQFVPTFVPYRDTNQDELVSEDRASIIFKQDIDKLSSGKVIALLSLYNDISKDDGIAFEIGYCFANNIPIVLMNTDFVWYRTISDCQEFIFDPIIQYMCARARHSHVIPDDNTSFESRLKSGFSYSLSLLSGDIKKFLSEEFRSREVSKSINSDIAQENTVFIDFCGGKCEYHREYANKISAYLATRNIKSYTSQRYSPELSTPLLHRAECDISRLISSRMVIVSGEEPEVDSGTAAIVGTAFALNKVVLLYYSGNIEILGQGSQRMTKNLMVENACTKICPSFDNLISTISDYISARGSLC